MLPSLLDQILGAQRQQERDAEREHRDLQDDRRRRSQSKPTTVGPRPRPRRQEYLAHAKKELAKVRFPVFPAAMLVNCLPPQARGDAYRYIEMLLRDGVVLKDKRGWYRKP